MSATIAIDFLNNSAVEWNVDENSYTTDPGVDITSWPNAPLQPIDGAAACTIVEKGSKIADGHAGAGEFFFFCWNDGQWRFGVRINVPIQVIGIGGRPSWEVMWDQNLENENISWQPSGDNPAVQFSWPSSIGYNIVATPQSGHEALSIKVIITDQAA